MNKKRLCLCVFYEKNGVLRNYVSFYLNALKEVCEKIIVIANGKITQESKNKLKELDIDLIQRENKGLDFGAWKETLFKIGFENLKEYDELILTNTTCYGPLYSFSEIFNKMDKKECDFWGITKHPEVKKDNIPKHIQSYFLVFKNNVFTSNAFKSWWKKVKQYNDFFKVVMTYEVQLTKFLNEAGFKSNSYIDLKDNKDTSGNPMFYTDEQLELGLPLIKRKAIILDYPTHLKYSLTTQGNNILNYIKSQTKYNIDLIFEDIINTQKMSDIKTNLHLNYCLPVDFEYKQVKYNQSVALIMHIYYEDLIQYCLNYMYSMPHNSDIYIVSPKEKVIEKCKEILKGNKHYNFFYRQKNNRGRDLSAYFVACKDVFEKYELICCMHDKKTPTANYLYGRDFAHQCFECNLKSKKYVSNIINIFNTNKHIGLLTNPIIAYTPFAKELIGNEIYYNETNMLLLYEKLNLTIPFDNHPIAPFGSMFWIRKNAIQPLLKYDWQYEDFPDEPMPDNGTISHAIERILPSIAQQAGYMTGWIMPNDFSSIYVDNLIGNIEYKPKKIKLKFIEKIFSIKNMPDKKHKLITVFGISIKIKK